MRERKLGGSLFGSPHLGTLLLLAAGVGLAVVLILWRPFNRPGPAPAEQVPDTDWSSYGGDKGGSKYSPLDQIGADNFSRLQVAWTWRSPDEELTKAHPELKTWVWESTPLIVGGVLYISTSLSQVAAIDAATGKTRWVYDPETWKKGMPSNNGFAHRGAPPGPMATTLGYSSAPATVT